MSNNRVDTKFVIINLDKQVQRLTKRLMECWYGEEYGIYLDEASITRSDEIFKDILTDLGMWDNKARGAVANAVSVLHEIEQDNLVDDNDFEMVRIIVEKSAKEVLDEMSVHNLCDYHDGAANYKLEREISANAFLLRRVEDRRCGF